LRRRVEEGKKEQTMSDDTVNLVKSLFKDVVRCEEKEVDVKRLFEAILGEDDDSEYSTENKLHKELVRTVIEKFKEELQVLSLRVNGHSTSVRYSPDLVRFALQLSRTPSAYRTVSGYLSMPGTRQIKRYRAGEMIMPERDPEPYIKIMLACQDLTDRNIQVIQDGFKIVGGIMWNTSTNEIFSFEEIGIHFSDLEKVKTSTDQVQYVSQYIVRFLASKETFICSYFEHSKEPTGEKLAQELFFVIRELQTIAFKVKGVCTDGGGPEARLFRLLCGHTTAPKENWLSLKHVSFDNPFETLCFIIYSFCGVHVLKSIRNALYNDKRQLCFQNGDINWFPHIIDCNNRENRLKEDKKAPVTRMTDDVANPDGMIKMRVHCAKIVFESETICEMLLHAISLLKKLSNKEIPQDFVFPDHCDTLVGKVRHLLELFRAFPIPNIGDLPVISSLKFCYNLLKTLEFMSVINSLFNDMLIKSGFVFSKENINKYETYVSKVFEDYFGVWKTESKGKCENFLAHQTWFHLRVVFRAAFELARVAFVDHEFISNTRTNQSCIELVFCQVRNGAGLFGKLDLSTYRNSISIISTDYLRGAYNSEFLDHKHTYLSEDVDHQDIPHARKELSYILKTDSAVHSCKIKVLQPLEEWLSQNTFESIDTLPGKYFYHICIFL